MGGDRPDRPDQVAATGDTARRRRAAALAGHTGDRATARAATQDPAGTVRATGWGALARLGALTDDDLATAAGDPDPAVRRRAAELVAEVGDRRPAREAPDGEGPDGEGPDGEGPHGEAPDGEAPHDEALHGDVEGPSETDRGTTVVLGLLDDDDPTVVEVAAWAAGEHLGADRRPPGADVPTTVVDRLAALATTHDDALVREAAVAALGAIGDRRGLPTILTATTDKATVRRRAVLALAPFDGDEVDAALRRATEDRDWQVRQAAEDLLDPDR